MNINYLNFNKTTTLHQGKVPYISFYNFDKLDFVKNGFSTRVGGISQGEFESMNLSFTRGDAKENVEENFRRIADAIGVKPENMVYAMQTHTTNVMEVTDEHKGMGVVRDRNFTDVDGFVTDIPGITLVTTYADCVPIFLADPVHKAIGAVHSGWKGTVGNISDVAVKKMNSLYGSVPEDMVAFIGPSICKNCYEVGEDVAEEFAKAYKAEVFDGILTVKEPYRGKYLLDLHKANYMNLINAGLMAENIQVTDICTCCNPKLLFSHRASKGRRGGMCGFLTIK